MWDKARGLSHMPATSIGVVCLDYGGLGGAVMEVAVGRHVG